jgi:kynurenine formamidase
MENNLKVQFLSHFLDQNTPAYGGEKGCVKFKNIRQISLGDTSNNSRFSFPSHIGTHVDFPYHFDSKGKKCNDYSPSFWIFNKVAFISCSVDQILPSIQNISSDIELLILKTGFGVNRNKSVYWSDQPIISSNLAKIFKIKFPKLRVFGFDMISLTSRLDRDEGKKAHQEFLIENEILILEDMNLVDLSDTPNKVIIAPLLVEGADGTPCTVISF